MSETPETTLPPDSPAPEAPPVIVPPTGEAIGRAVDVALGAVVVVGETVLQAVRRLQAGAPGAVSSLEQRGHPVREQIATALRDAVPPLCEAAFQSPTEPEPAPDEIAVLEARVKELEQQIAAPPVASAPAEETPAEEATYVPDEDPPGSLADSPYAVSETPEEQAAEGEKPAPGTESDQAPSKKEAE